MLAMGHALPARTIVSKYHLRLRERYESEPMMIIVAIGWLYVVMMIAAVSDTLLIGIVRLLFLGVLPVGLLLWIKLKSFRARAEAAEAREMDQ